MSKSIEVARTTHRVIADYMGTKPGEKVVIVIDTRTSPSIAEGLAGAAHALGADPVIVMMTPRAKSGMEPPEPITAAMIKADVVIAAASRSMYHRGQSLASRPARAASSTRPSRRMAGSTGP